MATSDELLVVDGEEGGGLVQEFRVKDDLDAIVSAVEQVDPPDLLQDWGI